LPSWDLWNQLMVLQTSRGHSVAAEKGILFTQDLSVLDNLRAASHFLSIHP
jgi:hypothetical protein